MGALALGRVIAGLGSRVIYVTDVYSAPLVRDLLSADEELIEFPMADHRESWDHAAHLIDRIAPSVTIAPAGS
jgi:hypothetical protein